jgi:pimeloyl-ACP methyl ester carboxylesterase
MAIKLNGEECYLNRPDGKIYYVKTGNGEPVVLLHSAGYSAESWANVVPALSSRFTCYVVDLPGYDHSDVPTYKYTIEDFAQAISEVMAHAGIDRASFVGDHTGAMIAVHMAVNHPRLVDKIVCDGLPYWNKERGRIVFERFMMRTYTDTTSYDTPVLPVRTWENYQTYNPEATRDGYDRYVELLNKCRLWWRYTHEATTNYDMQSTAAKVTQPLLVIYSEGDYLRRGEAKLREETQASVQVIAGVSTSAHFDPRYWPELRPTNPVEFNSLAMDFLLQSHE